MLNTKTSRLDALRNKLISDTSKNKGKNNQQNQKDERFWKLTVDPATGQGSAIIRFLPSKTDQTFPYVELRTHGFKGDSGKWFIDNCPTTIGDNCPVCELQGPLWSAGTDEATALAGARKKKKNYISNILVINDPKVTENNGKVFLYRYGAKILEKITELCTPDTELGDSSNPPVDPFDWQEGANFRLRQVKGAQGWPNYDRSSFDPMSTIGDEDRIAEISSQLHSLEDLVKPSVFKGYNELKSRFEAVISGGNSSSNHGTTNAPELPSQPSNVVLPSVAPSSPSPEVDADEFFANLSKNAGK